MRDVETCCYRCIEEFCDEVNFIFERLDTDNGESIGIIAKYDDAKVVLSELCVLGHDIHNVTINPSEWDGYCDEFVIELCDIGIFCEPLKRKGEYLSCEDTYVFIFGDCNSKALSKIDSNFIKEVEIDEYDYDDDDYEYDDEDYDDFDYGLDCCCHCCDIEDDMYGFTASKSDRNGYSSISFYGTELYNTKDVMDFLSML